MRIHCFQHVAFESSGTILEWIKNNNHNISYTYFFEDDFTIPKIETIDALLILGGYMNVDEEQKFTWLKTEKAYIKLAIDKGKKVMGICLGSQLISTTLGAKVYSGLEKEIGFFPIQFNQSLLSNHFSAQNTFFHWHGDTFDLPVGAQLIASSTACKHQAYFLNNNVLALQFHPEMNETVIEQMLLHDGHELKEKGSYIQSKETIRNQYHYLKQNKIDFFQLLHKFFHEL